MTELSPIDFSNNRSLWRSFHFIRSRKTFREDLFIHRSVERINEISHVFIRGRFLADLFLVDRLQRCLFPHWHRLRCNRISRYARTATIYTLFLHFAIEQVSTIMAMIWIIRLMLLGTSLPLEVMSDDNARLTNYSAALNILKTWWISPRLLLRCSSDYGRHLGQLHDRE